MIPWNQWILDVEGLDFIISIHFIITLHYQGTKAIIQISTKCPSTKCNGL